MEKHVIYQKFIFRCDEAIQYFILNKNDSALFPPALLYKLLVVFVWIILTAWVSAFITLLIRVIFVVDFQLVKVTIRSQDSERIMSSTVFKTEDDRDAGSPIEDGKEQHLTYKDTSEC